MKKVLSQIQSNTAILTIAGLAAGALLFVSVPAQAQKTDRRWRNLSRPHLRQVVQRIQRRASRRRNQLPAHRFPAAASVRSTAGLVDFGATDGPMNDDQIAQSKVKLVHIPTVLGAVVPIFNVSGVSDLKFSPEVLADIFLGKITTWNDGRIAKDNPGVKLPAEEIKVVPPLRWQRHQLHLHRLSFQGQQRLGHWPRKGNRAQLAQRHRRQRQ